MVEPVSNMSDPRLVPYENVHILENLLNSKITLKNGKSAQKIEITAI